MADIRYKEPVSEDVKALLQKCQDGTRIGKREVEQFDLWLTALMGGPEWLKQVDSFSDETS